METNKKQIVPIEKFKTAGEWFRHCRSLGFAVPVQAGHKIEQYMTREQVSFPEAYYACLKDGVLVELDEANIVIAVKL